jgi:hypothetical protein
MSVSKQEVYSTCITDAMELLYRCTYRILGPGQNISKKRRSYAGKLGWAIEIGLTVSILQEIYQIDIEIYVKVDISILSFPYAWLLQIIVQEPYVPSKSSTLVLRLAFGGGLDGPGSPVCMDVVKIIESYGYNAVNPLYRRSNGVCCYCYCYCYCYFVALHSVTFCRF